MNLYELKKKVVFRKINNIKIIYLLITFKISMGITDATSTFYITKKNDGFNKAEIRLHKPILRLRYDQVFVEMPGIGVFGDSYLIKIKETIFWAILHEVLV